MVQRVSQNQNVWALYYQQYLSVVPTACMYEKEINRHTARQTRWAGWSGLVGRCRFMRHAGCWNACTGWRQGTRIGVVWHRQTQGVWVDVIWLVWLRLRFQGQVHPTRRIPTSSRGYLARISIRVDLAVSRYCLGGIGWSVPQSLLVAFNTMVCVWCESRVSIARRRRRRRGEVG